MLQILDKHRNNTTYQKNTRDVIIITKIRKKKLDLC
jgi:hypothetical protein